MTTGKKPARSMRKTTAKLDTAEKSPGMAGGPLQPDSAEALAAMVRAFDKAPETVEGQDGALTALDPAAIADHLTASTYTAREVVCLTCGDVVHTTGATHAAQGASGALELIAPAHLDTTDTVQATWRHMMTTAHAKFTTREVIGLVG